jgi:hypothetical protein
LRLAAEDIKTDLLVIGEHFAIIINLTSYHVLDVAVVPDIMATFKLFSPM